MCVWKGVKIKMDLIKRGSGMMKTFRLRVELYRGPRFYTRVIKRKGCTNWVSFRGGVSKFYVDKWPKFLLPHIPMYRAYVKKTRGFFPKGVSLKLNLWNRNNINAYYLLHPIGCEGLLFMENSIADSPDICNIVSIATIETNVKSKDIFSLSFVTGYR